jgi:hypothetical protein
MAVRMAVHIVGLPVCAARLELRGMRHERMFEQGVRTSKVRAGPRDLMASGCIEPNYVRKAFRARSRRLCNLPTRLKGSTVMNVDGVRCGRGG